MKIDLDAKRREREVSMGCCFLNAMRHLIKANMGTTSSARMATKAVIFR